MCCMLLVIQVAEEEWIFSSLLYIFPVCHGIHRAVYSITARWLTDGVSCRLPVYRRIFSCLLWIFPVIHSWSVVHQSSICRVVDVLCAVSYTVAEYEWIFSSLLWIFSCVSWFKPCSSLSDPWCYLQTPCVSADFSCLLWIFFCHSLLGICAWVQYVHTTCKNRPRYDL